MLNSTCECPSHLFWVSNLAGLHCHTHHMDSVPCILVPKNHGITYLAIHNSKHFSPPTNRCVWLSTYHSFPCSSSCRVTGSNRPNDIPMKVFCDSNFRSDHKHKYLPFHECVPLPSIAAVPSSVFYTASLKVDCNTEVFETRDKNALDWYCLNRWLQGHFSIPCSTGNFNPQRCPSVTHKLGH